MKAELDRLYATLACVHGFVDGEQFVAAYQRHLRGEAPSVLQALLDLGSLRHSDRKSLESAVRRCLAQTLDELLLDESMAAIRKQLRDDPIWHDALASFSPELNLHGRYRLEKILGQGGMGRVWLAKDKILNRPVAVKELTPAAVDSPNARARFVREARVTGRLEHPFIVPVYELQSAGALYYVMRLVQGVPLDEAIKSYHSNPAAGRSTVGRSSVVGKIHWDLPRLLNVFLNVCGAVTFAHTKGVVHRDLKPENICLGNYGEVFVLDWGLAKVLGDEGNAEANAPADEVALTVPGQALGTPGFMSPEQAAGRSNNAQPATDIFGLGGILYAILTGRAPHAAHASLPKHEMLRRIATEPVPPARQVLASVPPALEAICQKALALKPTERYGTAFDLEEDVRCWTLGEPVSVYQEPPSAPRSRMARLLDAALALLPLHRKKPPAR